MAYVVTNCFDWIGYHLVNHLLNQGQNVIGFDEISSDKKETLSLFFGRNELFTLNPSKRNKQGDDIAISVDVQTSGHSERTIQLRFDKPEEKRKTNIVSIKLPLLFGEWMEMNDDGFYDKNDFVRFDSERFLTEAIYIKDFIYCVMQFTKSAYLPELIEIKSFREKEMNDADQETSIYVRDKKPITENLKIVQAHYAKFRKLYGVI
ncbi:hypothetical protein [Virgibacillus oceani]|uniref:Uncharacterized protein n=1 Tax=Virgibacillus oceani TaxID=1479511 RepID=A0A917HDP3_9BACI|nr:hypothetical protein [Virgibacillus oceani]GGG75653.1 hypothetical protein GCM10011398_20650 [Virgibacillus oceani]